jgi:hypothetical protein
MRKITITLLAAAVAVLVLTGVGTWTNVRTSTPINAFVGPHPSAMTGAKGRPTLHYDDYSLVFY